MFFSTSIQAWSLLKADGCIYLGLCVQMFSRLAQNKVGLAVLVRLVLHSEVKEINLVSGSHTILMHSTEQEPWQQRSQT
jgi:hypothetical protein